MSLNPFYPYMEQIYTLTFQDTDTEGRGPYVTDAYGNIQYDADGEPIRAEPETFQVEAILEAASDEEKKRLGYDSSTMLLYVDFANPKEGDVRITHNSRCSVSPSFRGLTGTLVFKGQPDADFALVKAYLGESMRAIFEESADGTT